MAVQTFRITANDTLTPLGVQLKQKNTSGVLTAVDLSGYTVKFKMVDNAENQIVAETATGITVVDAATGKVQYDFTALQVADPGDYWGWFVVYSGVESATFPIGKQLKICIEKDIVGTGTGV